jgi:hypothetical protein
MGMGDLARLPRPDEAGDSYDVPLDPWQRAAIAAQALEQTAPPTPSGPPPNMGSLYGMATAGDIAQTVGKKYGDAVAYYAGMPAMAVSPPPNPYPEGSEEAQFWDNSLQDAKRNWAIQTGAGMVFDPLGVKRSIGAAGSLTSGAGSRIIQPESQGIKAYHSSPHDFEKFDFSPARGRTGQGAQSYGGGGYFAENPAVSGRGGQYWQEFAEHSNFTPAEAQAARELEASGFDREKALQAMQALNRGTYGKLSPREQRLYDVRRNAMDLLASDKPIIGPRTYEVNIKARPDELWRMAKNPLEAPGGFVIDANKYMRGPETSAMLQEAGIPGIRYLDQGSRSLPPQYDLSNPGQLAAYAHKLSPHNPLGAIDIVEGQVGEAARELIRAKANLPALADTAQRTSNYVMFPGTEDKVHIMAKYGLAGAVPTMGSLADMSYREQ